MQKGFAPVLALIGVLVIIVVAGGAYYLFFSRQVNIPIVQDKVNQANDLVVKTDLDNLQQALGSYKQQNRKITSR